MHHFTYKDDRLFAEDVDLTALAETVGTPFYVYCEATLRRHLRIFADAFGDTGALIAYSVKANSNISVLKVLASEGAGADVVSAGELHRALRAGVAPRKIVFSGVGKTRDELSFALDADIYQFNVESEPELIALNEIAQAKGRRAPIALRINPDVAAGGHENISTGKSEDKFGVPWSRARSLYATARNMKGVNIKGVDVHIGSQIDDLAPFEAAFKKIAVLINDLRSDGCAIERLDLGGGLGIPYGEGATPPHPDAYAAMIKRVTAPLGVQLIFEPGRMIAGNAGALVARVIYVKDGATRKFIILDAGMNDFMRPALYDAYHALWPVVKSSDVSEAYDVAGPICESTDRFAKARTLERQHAGDLIAIMSTGAYGASQTSQYNSRPLIPEILASGERYAVIRKRPTLDEMMDGEAIADWLR